MGKCLTTEIFIERAKKVHGDKYDYSKVEYVDYRTKVSIICPVHGEFMQTPDAHLNQAHGCKLCGYEKNANAQRKSLDDFIEDAKKIHGDKYGYSEVNYVNSATSIKILCPKHGPFRQLPRSHLRGDGCPKCAGVAKLTNAEFIEKAKKIHGDKYDYSKVSYINNQTKVCIICSEHGEFWQSPHTHLQGKGCPTCGLYHDSEAYKKAYLTKKKNGTLRSSSLEDSLYVSLCQTFLMDDIYSEYNKDDRYPFHCDFYIKSLDLFIEVNGHYTHNDHWFDENDENDIKQLEEWKYRNESDSYGCYSGTIDVWTRRDVIKREHARKNNLNYVVLWNKEDIDDWIAEGYPIRQDWK